MSHFTYQISDLVINRFIELWTLVLACCGLAPFLIRRFPLGMPLAVSSHRNCRRLRDRDFVYLALFVAFLTAYIAVRLWNDDFASADNEQITEFSLKGRSIPPPIFPTSGRMFPLHLQEFNVLMHFSRSPTVFHIFAALELIAWVVLTMAALSEFALPLRLCALFLIMSTPSFVISFADLIYPERNVLFWLALFILCRRRYSVKPSGARLAGTLISVQFALYYKEPVWLLFVGFAAAQLAFEWRTTPPANRTLNFIEKNPADIGIIALAALFPILFVVVMFRSRSLTYVTNLQLPLSSSILKFLQVDALLFVFAIVFIIRILRILRGKDKFENFWDPLAVGAACYAVGVIGIKVFSPYYMAPVDTIAVLFLLQYLRTWHKETTAMRSIIAAICFLITIQNVAYSFVYITSRKNIEAGKIQLAGFLGKYVGAKKSKAVRIFFPYASGYDLMELSAFLEYKGLPVRLDARSQGSSIVFESPLSFSQGRCVGYREDRCTHVDAPDNGDLIAELATDDVPEGGFFRNRCGELFAYQPFWVSPKTLHFFEALKTVLFVYRTHLPRRWLQLHVYTPCASN